MPETAALEEAAAKVRVMASALSIGRRLELLSLLLLAIALVLPAIVGLPLQARIGFLVSILAAGLQVYFGLRVAFDARIFEDWSRRWDRMRSLVSDTPSLEFELASFDRALGFCGLRKNSVTPNSPPRGLESRLLGASRQLKRQALALLVQFVALACVTFILQFSTF